MRNERKQGISEEYEAMLPRRIGSVNEGGLFFIQNAEKAQQPRGDFARLVV